MSQRKKSNHSLKLEEALINRMNRKKISKEEEIIIQDIDSIDLKKSLENFHKYAKKYAKKHISSLDKIIYDLENQEYKIAVVANMSSGKSTFINALLGEEALPAFNEATTDCATFIHSEPNIEKKAIVYFSDNKEQIVITENLKREIKQYAKKDENCNDEKYKNVEKIELFYPFKNIQTSTSEDFRIIFIDTPGPNSTGGDYAQKHKDQTRAVLNDVDLALFMFDYTQLDANLKSDEQGLWNTIKKRHDIDRNFDVYFILNKIDYALKDNNQYIKDNYSETDGEFYELKKEKWYLKEKEAIEKLHNAALEHNIENPKIYPVSSYFQLLLRAGTGWDDTKEDELNSFQKRNFKKIYNERWEDESIDYIGIKKLEDDINEYVNHSVKNKILTKIYSQLNSIKNDEKKDLNRRLQVLQKPKAEADNNLKLATHLLENEAKQLQKDMKSDSKVIEDKYSDKIHKIIDDTITIELRNKIEELAIRTIHFAQSYAGGDTTYTAKNKAKKLALNQFKINLNDEKVRVPLEESINTENINNKMQKFMNDLLGEYKNNYLDSKSEIKEEYFELQRSGTKSFTHYKQKLEKKLGKSLGVSSAGIDENKIGFDTLPDMDDVDIPVSVLAYDFKKAKYKTVSDSSWWNPFSWGDTKRKEIKSEEHTFIIYPKELQKSISRNIDENIENFVENEKNNHDIIINKYLSNNMDIFQKFRQDKQIEIDKLREDIQSSEKSLDEYRKQLDEFKKAVEE